MKRRAALTLGLIMALGVSACGVGTEDTAHEIPAPAGSSHGTFAPTGTGPYVETLYLVRDGSLVPVQRNTNRKPTAAMLINDLVAGPTGAEAGTGLTSALLGTDVVAEAVVINGVAKVALADTIQDTGRTDEIAALGQIVCTLTQVPGIFGVQFTRNEQTVKVPRADASLTIGPLTAVDYMTLVTVGPGN
jgi:hypothetical protein